MAAYAFESGFEVREHLLLARASERSILNNGCATFAAPWVTTVGP